MMDHHDDELLGKRERSRFRQQVVLADEARRIGFSISEVEKLKRLYYSHLEDRKNDE